MTTKAEQGTTEEILSPAELGERTHGVITDIATKLQGVPEFGNALHKAFFGRSFRKDDRNILDHVYFEKGKYGYSIDFQAAPRRFGPEEIGSYTPSIRLTIHKYKKLDDETLESPAEPVASAYLTTAFIEDQNGKILNFTYGDASVEDSYWNDKYKDAAALEKMPEILRDLFAPIKL